MTPDPLLGTSPTRTDGAAKVTGRARYIDDVQFEGALHGKTIRTNVARGRLQGIRFLPGVPWEEFIVVTAQDIPGANVVTLIDTDQPYLVHDQIRHVAEPVALIAHADKGLVEKAARLVELDITPEPAVFTPDASLEAGAAGDAQYGADNVFKHFHVARGDAKAALAKAPVVVTGTYETGAQEQLYIEPQGVVAVASPEEGVTVWGSLQCPYYVHKALGPLFGLPPGKVRVLQAVTGGGFGGKEEYPIVIAGHAALLAWKSGAPGEADLRPRSRTCGPRPSATRAARASRPASRADGTLLALDIDVLLDGGAYVTLSPVVLSRGTLHAAGAYRCNDVAIDGTAVLTNTPPYGAFRGFGAPQTIFAIEMHMERAARELGMDPIALRRKNFLRKGDILPTGQVLADDPGLSELLDTALAAVDWPARHAAHAKHNAVPGASRRGLGVSTFYFHGCGFTGSGEVKLASRAAVEIAEDGHVRVLAASTDIGQGTITVFGQIVADRLGVALDAVEIADPTRATCRTAARPWPSRTTMVVGGLLDAAAADLREALVAAGRLPAAGHTPAQFLEAARAHHAAEGETRFERQYTPPAGVVVGRRDLHRRRVRDLRVVGAGRRHRGRPGHRAGRGPGFVAVQEVGRALHPTLAAGQIEGGTRRARLGDHREVVLKDGAMCESPADELHRADVRRRAADPRHRSSSIRIAFGPSGAKGVGELPMDGPAPRGRGRARGRARRVRCPGSRSRPSA